MCATPSRRPRPLVYGSVCSGIEAATVAWKPLGWRGAFFSEIEAFPRAVLAHHYPDVPLHGDFTTIKAGEYEPIDVLVGGTPCQSFSIAGLRGGLSDGRGNLALEFLRLADRLRPRWVVWENVPGVLSSNGGRDFGSILGGMVELGYGVAYRVLDAQYFGVAQRRRRVFVVGYLGDWRPAVAVLFERDCLSGNPAPRREAGQAASARAGDGTDLGGGRGDGGHDVAGTLDARARAGGFPGTDGAAAGHVVPSTARTLRAQHNASHRADSDTYIPAVAHSLRADGFDASEDGTGRGTPLVPCPPVASCLTRREGKGPDSGATTTLIFQPNTVASSLTCRSNPQPNDPCFTLTGAGSGHAPHVALPVGVDGSDLGFARSANPSHSGDKGDGGVNTTMIAVYGNHAQDSRVKEVQASPALPAKAGTGGGNLPLARVGMAVRRLTPRECERLQGFPDDYTLVPIRSRRLKDIAEMLAYWRYRIEGLSEADARVFAADGPRYKALGNSMAVPAVAWIGEGIQAVETILTGTDGAGRETGQAGTGAGR